MLNQNNKDVNEILSLIHQLNTDNNSGYSTEQLLQMSNLVQDYFKAPAGASGLKGDYHVHTIGSHDATGKVGAVVKTAQKLGLKEIAITDHNKISEIQIFLTKLNQRIKEYNSDSKKQLPLYDLSSPIHNVNGVNVIPGVEVTCVIPGVKSDVDKPLKVHMLVYGPKLDKPNPLSRLLNAKASNDMLVDFGLFKILEKKYGVSFSEDKIKEYIINRRQQIKGFGRFGAKDIIDFLQYNNITLANNYKEIRDVLKAAPGPERMQLNINDVIKAAHASGGICVLAHPAVNLNRVAVDQNAGQTRAGQKAQVIKTLLNSGIDGFECFYNSKNIDIKERSKGEPTTTEIIKNEVKQFVMSGKNRGNQIIFTGGSDTHFMKDDELNSTQTLGTTNRGEINLEGLSKFRTEILRLMNARLQGEITHRNYKTISKDEIEQIVQQYTLTAQNFERSFLEGVDNFAFTYKLNNVQTTSTNNYYGANAYYNKPKNAKNFNTFVLEELTQETTSTSSASELEQERTL